MYLGSVSDIAGRGDVSSVEAQELNNDVKKSILLIAWSVALVDFDLSPSESQKLNEYASMFGFDYHESDATAKLAKYEMLSSIMDPYMSKDDLYRYASGIDVSNEDAEIMLIKFKKSVTY